MLVLKPFILSLINSKFRDMEWNKRREGATQHEYMSRRLCQAMPRNFEIQKTTPEIVHTFRARLFYSTDAPIGFKYYIT